MESRHDPGLSAALRALPLEAPPADAWPAIRSRMAGMQIARQRSPWPWLALAASLGLVALASPLFLVTPQSTAPQAPPVALVDTELDGLKARSQQLEGEIHALRAANPEVDEFRFALEQAIEDELTLVDVGLTAPGGDRDALWRARVQLLEELKAATAADSGALWMQASVY
jgi:hypothetical protein